MLAISLYVYSVDSGKLRARFVFTTGRARQPEGHSGDPVDHEWRIAP